MRQRCVRRWSALEDVTLGARELRNTQPASGLSGVPAASIAHAKPLLAQLIIQAVDFVIGESL